MSIGTPSGPGTGRGATTGLVSGSGQHSGSQANLHSSGGQTGTKIIEERVKH